MKKPKIEHTPTPWIGNERWSGTGNEPRKHHHFLIQTDLVDNGPEATIAEIDIDVLSTYGPIGHEFHGITKKEMAANMDFIVQACNNFDALLSVAKTALGMMEYHEVNPRFIFLKAELRAVIKEASKRGMTVARRNTQRSRKEKHEKRTIG